MMEKFKTFEIFICIALLIWQQIKIYRTGKKIECLKLMLQNSENENCVAWGAHREEESKGETHIIYIENLKSQISKLNLEIENLKNQTPY